MQNPGFLAAVTRRLPLLPGHPTHMGKISSVGIGSETPGYRKGAMVAIVGPDGVGKTTLARALLQLWPGPVGYFHFRPPIVRPLEKQPAQDTGGLPKAPRSGSRVFGWLRLALNLARFWVGYTVRVLPVVRRGGLVVADRWAYGYLAQPHGLKYYGPVWLASLLLRLFPQPSAVIVASAPIATIFSRKQELTPAEILDEQRAWDQVPALRKMSVATTAAPDVIASQVIEALLVESE